MNKKILSLIIILCTIISVFIIRYAHKINIDDNFISNRIRVFNHKQNKQQNNNENNNIKKYSYLFSDICVSNINSDYKKSKFDELGQKFEYDKEDFFKQSGEIIKNNNTKSTNESSEEEKENKYTPKLEKNLTAVEKEKLLTVSNKLSAVDYEKVKMWLGSDKSQESMEALKLLKQRLSNDDYQKIKSISDEFIGIN